MTSDAFWLIFTTILHFFFLLFSLVSSTFLDHFFTPFHTNSSQTLFFDNFFTPFFDRFFFLSNAFESSFHPFLNYLSRSLFTRFSRDYRSLSLICVRINAHRRLCLLFGDLCTKFRWKNSKNPIKGGIDSTDWTRLSGMSPNTS